MSATVAGACQVLQDGGGHDQVADLVGMDAVAGQGKLRVGLRPSAVAATIGAFRSTTGICRCAPSCLTNAAVFEQGLIVIAAGVLVVVTLAGGQGRAVFGGVVEQGRRQQGQADAGQLLRAARPRCASGPCA